jgi:hypothetical protein
VNWCETRPLKDTAGTIFGAWLTARSRAKKEIVDDLKAVRTAFAVAVTICNQAMALKRQHVRPMKTRYDEAIEAHRRDTTAPTGRPIAVFLDLAVMPRTNFPDDILRNLIFEKSSIGERAAIIAIELFTALENVNIACDSRTALSEEFRKETTLTSEQRASRYLGLSMSNGFTDARFPHNMEGLRSYTDDRIFFSKLLADWSMAQEYLIPSPDQYTNWMRVFPARKKSLLSIFGARLHKIVFRDF